MALISAAAAFLLSFDAGAAGRNAFTAYEQYLKEAVASAGLPEQVAYMPLVLSGGDPAYRDGSAAGIWSVTAPIARHYGVAVSDGFDGRYDVEYCTAAALAYFGELYRRNNGDLGAAMSQYALAAGQASKAGSFMNLLTEACADYEAERNGAAPQLVSVTLESAVLLPELIKALGISASRLQVDNPAVISGGNCLPANAKIRLAPEQATRFGEVCGKLYDSARSAVESVETPLERTASTAEAVKESTAAKSGSTAKQPVTYKIKSGDTLGGIASRYHVSVSQLKKWNNLKSDRIGVGKILKIYK